MLVAVPLQQNGITGLGRFRWHRPSKSWIRSTTSKALLISNRAHQTFDPWWMYRDETSFSNPVQRSVEKPFLHPNCKSHVQKTSGNNIKMHSSNTCWDRKPKQFHG